MCLTIFANNNTLKAEGDVSIGASVDFFSKYIWRGQNLVDDWVLQPGANISYKGITASVWGNFDLTDENYNKSEFSEVDLALDYSGQVPGVDILSYSLGVIYYDFPVTVDAIVEGAKTGQIGDGKIFVLDLKECVRIRTGERGQKAIG